MRHARLGWEWMVSVRAGSRWFDERKLKRTSGRHRSNVLGYEDGLEKDDFNESKIYDDTQRGEARRGSFKIQ